MGTTNADILLRSTYNRMPLLFNFDKLYTVSPGSPIFLQKNTRPRRKSSGVGFFCQRFVRISFLLEDMPAVKVPMFSLGNLHEVLSAIVEAVVVDVVGFEMVRAVEYESMHADCVCPAVDDPSRADVCG